MKKNLTIFSSFLISLLIISINCNAQKKWEKIYSYNYNPRYNDYNGRPSIAVDKNNIVYVVYTDTVYNSHVLKFTNNLWTEVGNENEGVTASYSQALRIDTSGVPYINLRNAFIDYGIIKKFDGNQWVLVGDSFNLASSLTYFTISPQNIPYFSYIDANSGTAPIDRFDGEKWVDLDWPFSDQVQFEYVQGDDSGRLFGFAGDAIAQYDSTKLITVGGTNFLPLFPYYEEFYPFTLSKDGQITIALSGYAIQAENHMEVLNFNGSSWSQLGQLFFRQDSNYLVPNILRDSRDSLYLAFNQEDSITVMKYDGTKWITVGDSNFAACPVIGYGGENLSMCVDKNENVYVAFTKGTAMFDVGGETRTGFEIWRYSNNSTSSVNSPALLNSISLFPNPSSDMLNVSLSKSLKNGFVSLTDMAGRIIVQQPFIGNKESISVRNIPAGIYIVKVEDGSGFINKLFVKQ
jgi:hypothetical protein